MIRDVDTCKNVYVYVVPLGGTAKFQEFFFERTTKEMTASASYAMMIQVVAPPVGVSACGFHGMCFPSYDTRRLHPREFVRQYHVVKQHDHVLCIFARRRERRNCSIHDEDQSGCSTRENVVRMDWRIHPAFPQHVQWSSLNVALFFWLVSEVVATGSFFWLVSEVVAIEITSRHPVTRTPCLTISSRVLQEKKKKGRLLLHQKRRHRLTERSHQKVQVAEVTVLLCNYWHFPVCLNYKSESGCKYGEDTASGRAEVDGQPSKESKKSGVKGSVAFVQQGCVSHDSHSSKISLRRGGKLGSNHTVKFSRGTWHHTIIREREGPSRGVIHKCKPLKRNPSAPKFEERSQEETLHHERCSRRAAWDLAKNVYKLKKIRIKLRFTLSFKPGQCRWPLRNLQRNENSWLTPEHQCTC